MFVSVVVIDFPFSRNEFRRAATAATFANRFLPQQGLHASHLPVINFGANRSFGFFERDMTIHTRIPLEVL